MKTWLLFCIVQIYGAFSSQINTVDYVIERTKITGNVLNFQGKNIHVFKGIPYAKPPVGKLRFRAPVEQPLEEFENLDATKDYNPCIQDLDPNQGVHVVSEDCLYAAIWVPEVVRAKYENSGQLSAVVIVIHGGGFHFGFSWHPFYNGTALGTEEDVIVVSINYRLGMLGFLDFNDENAPGNMGLMDQQQAIKWTKKYIRYFGGNPKQITLMGLSAGSMSVSAHVINVDSRKLFQTGILDGGSILSQGFLDSQEVGQERGLEFAKAIGCSQNHIPAIVECMREKGQEEILQTQHNLGRNWIVYFKPTFGSKFMPKHPKLMISEISGTLPTIFAGTSEDEGSIFIDPSGMPLNIYPPVMSRKDADERIKLLNERFELTPTGDTKVYSNLRGQGVIDYLTDGIFTCAVIDFVDELSKKSAQIYLYQVNYFGAGSLFPVIPHAHHAAGFFYEMGLPLLYPTVYAEKDMQVSKKLLRAIGSLIKRQTDIIPMYGDQKFEKYNHLTREINVIETDGTLRVQSGSDRDQICQKMWNSQLTKSHDHHEL